MAAHPAGSNQSTASAVMVKAHLSLSTLKSCEATYHEIVYLVKLKAFFLSAGSPQYYYLERKNSSDLEAWCGVVMDGDRIGGWGERLESK
jgi:hypothetical protein